MKSLRYLVIPALILSLGGAECPRKLKVDTTKSYTYKGKSIAKVSSLLNIGDKVFLYDFDGDDLVDIIEPYKPEQKQSSFCLYSNKETEEICRRSLKQYKMSPQMQMSSSKIYQGFNELGHQINKHLEEINRLENESKRIDADKHYPFLNKKLPD